MATARGGEDHRAVFWLRLMVAALLATGALLKVFSAIETLAFSASYSIPSWAIAVFVQLELLLAALLVCGIWQRVVLRTTLVAFSLFAAFALFRALAGFDSCGCFGAITVNPWFTAAVDLFVVGGLGWAVFHTVPTAGVQATRLRLVQALVTYAIVGTTSLVVMMGSQPSRLTANSDTLVGDGLVILEPEEWVGSSFPLAGYLSPKLDLSRGRWTVLMYHHECPNCQEALPEYVRLAREQTLAGNRSHVLLIEVPPHGRTHRTEESIVHARLTDRREWFVQAPVELQLDDEIVTLVSLELPSIN